MNIYSRFFFRAWRPVLAAMSLALITYVLYFHNLSHLVPGYDSHELQAYRSAADWHTIYRNPLNIPFKALVWVAIALGHHSLLATRLVAAGFGVAAVLLFFIIARAWFGFRTAFFVSVLFATSSGLLHVARLGTPEILQMGVLLFVASLLWYRRSAKQGILSGYLIIITLALLLYIPGMVWFELFALVLLNSGARRRLAAMAKVHQIGWAALFLVLCVPLALAIVNEPNLALQAAGLPMSLHQLAAAPANILKTALSIGVHSPGNSELWVGHAPLLNAIELILGAIGLYFYAFRERSGRTIFLIGSTLISLLSIGVGGVAVFASFVPLAYLFIACGLEHLLAQWLTVFPRNPIARSFGIGMIGLMLFFSVLYQTRSYFVAWPHNSLTRHEFNHPQP